MIENALQLIGGLFGIILVSSFSRYYMITISTMVAFVFNVVLGIGSIERQPITSFVTICCFMFLEGSSLTSVIWSYSAELATPKIERYVALMSMTRTAIVTIIPPFILS